MLIAVTGRTGKRYGDAYFERIDGDVVWRWQISRHGIRCQMAWGQGDGPLEGSRMTLDDEAHAERYFQRKISEKRQQGYVEVAPGPTVEIVRTAAKAEADALADATLLDVMRVEEEKRYEGAWDFYWSGYEPVAGHEGVFAKCHDYQHGPGPFYDYLVLSEDERRGLYFIVKHPGHNPTMVSAFLDFIRPRLELAFDGRSHHKIALPTPIGQFDHVLLCAPSLCHYRYRGRLAKAFPILDCEIGDMDTETLVEARLVGRDSMPWTTWDREPFPVIDLRFDLRSENGQTTPGGSLPWDRVLDMPGDITRPIRDEKFKVYPRSGLELRILQLSRAAPGSRLEIRNHRYDVLALTSADLTAQTPADIDQFLGMSPSSPEIPSSGAVFRFAGGFIPTREPSRPGAPDVPAVSPAMADRRGGDGPDLSRALLDDLTRVLAGSGVPMRDAERLVGLVAQTQGPDAVADILQARPPERAAWIAPMAGYLHQVESGYLLTEEADPADDYTADASWAAGGGVSCSSGDQEGWLFGPLDRRVLRVPIGSKVEVGELLTDGPCDFHELLLILGHASAVAAAADRLAGQCALDLEDAEQVVRPLFDAVEIVDILTWTPDPWPGLPTGFVCTRRRFQIEQGRAIGRALQDLPPSADERLHAVAALHDDQERAEVFFAQRLWQAADDAGLSIDSLSGLRRYLGCGHVAMLLEQGGALPPGTGYDLGAFEVTGVTLRVTDPCYLKERLPAFDRFLGTELPAQPGTWRAFSFVTPPDPIRRAGRRIPAMERNECGPQVCELRVWADGRSAAFAALPDDEFHIMVDAGMAGCFDPGDVDRISPTAPEPAATAHDRLRSAGPPRATVVSNRGVVAETGNGQYRARAWRDDEGAVIAVSFGLHDEAAQSPDH
jgi:predicted DNA-binding WGR domain protein